MFQMKEGALVALFFTLSVSFCMQNEISIVWAIATVLGLTLLLMKLKKLSIRPAFSLAWTGIKEAKHVYILVLMIGMNVSMWIASGIVPTIIQYGFSVVYTVPFLPLAFVLCSFLGFFLGTGLGTLSTIGIAFFALGKSAGIPEPLLLGTLVSGAYIADRLSPLSALVNFALETADVSFKDAFKNTVKPLIPVFLITLIVYYFLGESYKVQMDTNLYKELLNTHFVISPWLFAVPILILILSFLNVGSTKILLGGILSGGVFAIFMQGETLISVLKYLVLGYEKVWSHAWLETFNIGGATKMIEVVVVIAGGITLLSFLEAAGFIEHLKNKWFHNDNEPRRLYFKTGLLSTLLDALTCDQTVGILLPSKHLKKNFKEKGLTNADLYTAIASSGTSLAPLMPWNVNAVIIYAITGVSALAFAPYALLNWLHFPMAWIFVAFIKKK